MKLGLACWNINRFVTLLVPANLCKVGKKAIQGGFGSSWLWGGLPRVQGRDVPEGPKHQNPELHLEITWQGNSLHLM